MTENQGRTIRQSRMGGAWSREESLRQGKASQAIHGKSAARNQKTGDEMSTRAFLIGLAFLLDDLDRRSRRGKGNP